MIWFMWRPVNWFAMRMTGLVSGGIVFYFDVSLHELPLSSFLNTSSHVSKNIIILWFIQRFLLIETHFHVETGQLLTSVDQLTGV